MWEVRMQRAHPPCTILKSVHSRLLRTTAHNVLPSPTGQHHTSKAAQKGVWDSMPATDEELKQLRCTQYILPPACTRDQRKAVSDWNSNRVTFPSGTVHSFPSTSDGPDVRLDKISATLEFPSQFPHTSHPARVPSHPPVPCKRGPSGNSEEPLKARAT